jgi:hypothetical protein
VKFGSAATSTVVGLEGPFNGVGAAVMEGLWLTPLRRACPACAEEDDVVVVGEEDVAFDIAELLVPVTEVEVSRAWRRAEEPRWGRAGGDVAAVPPLEEGDVDVDSYKFSTGVACSDSVTEDLVERREGGAGTGAPWRRNGCWWYCNCVLRWVSTSS